MTEMNIDFMWDDLNDQRKALQMSWRDVAKVLGVSTSTFTRMKSGKSPDLKSFAKMVEWVGGEPAFYLGLENFDYAKKVTCTKCLGSGFTWEGKGTNERDGRARI